MLFIWRKLEVSINVCLRYCKAKLKSNRKINQGHLICLVNQYFRAEYKCRARGNLLQVIFLGLAIFLKCSKHDGT